jgi:8-oxo-dGTP pyrophosphatase MutT (NUDIX family)
MNLAALTALVAAFEDPADDLAAKSRELVLMLLDCAQRPTSRDSFTPGHLTATAVVLAPDRERFALVHHARLNRWLLPGGHLEPSDQDAVSAARREAEEETGAALSSGGGRLVGIDVHGIPPRRGEPYHLHHDLIFALEAQGEELRRSAESHEVRWATLADASRFALAPSIVRAVRRAARRPGRA